MRRDQRSSGRLICTESIEPFFVKLLSADLSPVGRDLRPTPSQDTPKPAIMHGQAVHRHLRQTKASFAREQCSLPLQHRQME